MPHITMLSITAGVVRHGDTVVAHSIDPDLISKGKKVNLNDIVVTGTGWTNSDRARIDGVLDTSGPTETLSMYVEPDAIVTVLRTEATEDEKRANKCSAAARALADRKASAERTVEKMLSQMLDDDGKVCADRFLNTVDWGRADEVVEMRTLLYAIARVESIVEKQNAGEAGGDILDAIEMVEASSEDDARRMLNRVESSRSTNGYSNAIETARGVAYGRVAAGAMTRYPEMYGPSTRAQRAALIINTQA